jgi:uncharacterized membrane protein
MVSWVLIPVMQNMPHDLVGFAFAMKGVLLGVSIFMMIKASRDEAYALPVIGELAQRSAAEQ